MDLNTMPQNIHFAILSGICASTASTFGKLSWLPILQEYILIRIAFFACMVVCNGAVWTLFVKALQQTNSSLNATVISSASNYVFSAVTGFVLFGEITSLLWWSGMFLIIVGLLLVLSNDSSVDKSILNKNQ
ncbi:transmembrane protein 42 isoform X2 [Anoplophora glabripennis]|uniref:transmembrane protein 42 isoform X2 n=1 Tax=Anoplophora glabripennis TaxID=217634 RepID=UPI00087388FF|nr:transmembrane protein 42 isoform X2 [Anoplophora glabripennis]